MAPPSQVLLVSLPADVLLEILSLVLVDTPRSATRAAVIRTCSTLYSLGLLLLYRVLDLTGFTSLTRTLKAWKLLFGPKGALTKQR